MTQACSSLDPSPQVVGVDPSGRAVFTSNAGRAGLSGTVMRSFLSQMGDDVLCEGIPLYVPGGPRGS